MDAKKAIMLVGVKIYGNMDVFVIHLSEIIIMSLLS